MSLETSANPAVYAVIVTHNGSAWIEACLQSLKDSVYPVEIVVIDNASTDSTPLIVSRFANVTFLQQDQNLGFGRGNNIGIRVALKSGAEYVFLLNQDARITPHTIERLVLCAETNPDFGILSPMHLNHDGTQLDYAFVRYLSRGAPRFLSDLYFGHVNVLYSLAYVNAAAWLISRECLKRVGGFDPLFFMYSEDEDYAARVRYHDLKVGVVPLASVHHSRFIHSSEQKRKPKPKPVERLVAGMIGGLKDPSRSFANRYATVLWRTAVRSIHSLIYGEPKEAITPVLAWLRVNTIIVRIWQHRRMSQTRNMPWLRIDESDP